MQNTPRKNPYLMLVTEPQFLSKLCFLAADIMERAENKIARDILLKLKDNPSIRETPKENLKQVSKSLELHGDNVGNRCSQDWDGAVEDRPTAILNKLELDALLRIGDEANSHMREYDDGLIGLLDDEMLVSHCLSAALEVVDKYRALFTFKDDKLLNRVSLKKASRVMAGLLVGVESEISDDIITFVLTEVTKSTGVECAPLSLKERHLFLANWIGVKSKKEQRKLIRRFALCKAVGVWDGFPQSSPKLETPQKEKMKVVQVAGWVCIVMAKGRKLHISVLHEGLTQVRDSHADIGAEDEIGYRLTSFGIERSYYKNGDPDVMPSFKSARVKDWLVEFVNDEDNHLNIYVKSENDKKFEHVSSVNGADDFTPAQLTLKRSKH
jgi:hypothetical protein